MSNISEMPEMAGLEDVLQGTYLPVNGRLVSTYGALEDAIKRCVSISNNLKKPSTITLEIKIDVDGTTVPISTKLKTKEPEPSATPGLFFADSKGRLYGDDPNQEKLPIDMPKRKSR